MLGEALLGWMVEQDRSPHFLSHSAGMDPGRLIGLITGAVAAVEEDVVALADATGLSQEDLRAGPDDAARTGPHHHDPLQCYKPAEAAALLGVSADTIRKELRAGTIHHVVLGEHAWRIPRYAIADRLAGIG